MLITVKKPNNSFQAQGTLTVNTGVNPVTATFQPENGTSTSCTGVVWNVGPNGQVGFNFQVSGSANGNFPLKGGQQYTYHFSGTFDPNGSSPQGSVNWPSSDGADIDEVDTWQATASADESVTDESATKTQAAG
jgi:hypothetical protein